MVRLRATLWSVALAAFAVGASVAANQVYDHRLHWSWAYLAFLFTVLPGVYGPSHSAPANRVPRGRRRVYLRQLRAHVRDMETTGIATQGEYVFRLHQVYVDVSLRPATPQDATAAPYVGRSGAEGQRKTLSSFLDAGDRGRVYAVIGGPGSGKTTLMRATAGDLCGRWRHRRIPVLLYLRDHAAAIAADPEIGLAEVAAAAGWVTGRTPAPWIEAHLRSADCLVMLDGLDEVADQAERTAVVRWVRRQIDRYPRNDYLLTSRPHGYQANPLPRAEVLQVRRFTAEQISRFLHAWYYAIECRSTGEKGRETRFVADTKAEDLLTRLRSRPALYDLAANPLLLTMIANVHRYRAALPRSRAALYAEMCDVLVHRRQESKNLPDATELSGPQKEHIMGVLALTMMDARLRDIPVREACTAVAEALEGASPSLSPADFLRSVNRSGLLIEREHGCYAFAHLTLQEYLAATQTGPDAGHLPSKVDDPWWRETILLWSADSDVTPVIEACLTSGTVRALALAFDCAEEARTVDPAVRRRLDDLLEDGADGERRRLVAGIKAARELREVIRLSQDTPMCARPVSRSLYAMFVQEEQAQGRFPEMGSGESGDTPVTGLWAGDAVRFVAWLNGLFDDDTVYRLPTGNEVTDAAIGLVADPARHTTWWTNGGRPRLHRADGTRWPYEMTPEDLRRYTVHDRDLAGPYFGLALADVLDGPANDILRKDYRGIFVTAFTTGNPGPSLENIRDLALAWTLDQVLTGGRFPGPDHDLGRAVALGKVLGRRHELGDRVALNLVVRDIITRVLGWGGRFDHPSANRLDAIGDALRAELDEANGRKGRELERLRLRAADLTGTNLVHGLRALRSDLGGASLQFTLALDDALELPDPYSPHASVIIEACHGLLGRWTPEGRRFKAGAALTAFDAFMADTPSSPTPISEDPMAPLESLHLVLAAHSAEAGFARPVTLCASVRELIEPILGRTAPLDLEVVSHARLMLLAIAMLLRDVSVVARTVAIDAMRALVALEAKRDAPNDVLLLVRG